MRRILSLSWLLLLTACERPQSTLYPKGPAAGRIADVTWLMIIWFLVITVVMWVLIAWAMSRRRGTLAEHEPVDVGGGQKWVAYGGLVFPCVVLFTLFVLGLKLMASFPVDDPHHHDVTPEITLIGHQWWWEVRYMGEPAQSFTTANEIHIPVGRPVDIALDSQDVIHSFWVPMLHGKVDLIPGHPNFIRVEADKPGNLYGECAEYCGAQHAHMRLLVVAQPPDQYQAWKQGQIQPGAEPTGDDAKRGQQVFIDGPCSMCHQVRGTRAGGRVAPDLTHLASRQYIGANSFPNNDAYLEAWVTHAQSLKPEVEMPNLTQFTGRDLRALLAYLRQLK